MKYFILLFLFISCKPNKAENKPPFRDTVVSQELNHWDKGMWEMRTSVQIRTNRPSMYDDYTYITNAHGEYQYSFKNVFDSSIVTTYDTISMKRKPLYELAKHIIDTMRIEKNKLEAERKLVADTINKFYQSDTINKP
jgi:hypothetical protein